MSADATAAQNDTDNVLEIRRVIRAPHDAYGEYREADPPPRVVYKWNWMHEPDVRDTVVSIDFIDLGANGMELVLRHSGFATRKQRDSH